MFCTVVKPLSGAHTSCIEVCGLSTGSGSSVRFLPIYILGGDPHGRPELIFYLLDLAWPSFSFGWHLEANQEMGDTCLSLLFR